MALVRVRDHVRHIMMYLPSFIPALLQELHSTVHQTTVKAQHTDQSPHIVHSQYGVTDLYAAPLHLYVVLWSAIPSL